MNAGARVNNDAAFSNCLTGPTSAFATATCCVFDLDHDADVDLRDFAALAPQIMNP